MKYYKTACGKGISSRTKNILLKTAGTVALAANPFIGPGAALGALALSSANFRKKKPPMVTGQGLRMRRTRRRRRWG